MRHIKNIVRWLLGMFGWRDNSTWGIVIKRVWATCLVICVVVFTAVVMDIAVENILDELGIYERNPYSPKGEYVSDRVSFHAGYRHAGALIDDYSKKVLVKDIENVYCSQYEKWMVFVSKGKAGYMDRETLQVMIPPQYDFAWNFSEEVAAVINNGKLFFIRRDGTKAFEKEFQADHQLAVIEYDKGFCIMLGDDGHFGLIDLLGNWAFEPVYDSIEVTEEGIYAGDVNIKRLYDFDGKTVLNELVINEVTELYFNNANDDKELATLRKYSCREYGPYGLISTDGRMITKPIYKEIEAISKDLYLCKPQGVLIDSEGRIVGQETI